MPDSVGPRGGSRLLTRERVQQAVAFAMPVLDALVHDRSRNGSGVLHLVIMDPLKGPHISRFEEAILHEHTVGKPREQWDADYAQFARAKAKVSWQTGWDAQRVQSCAPWMLGEGDTVLWGSVVLDGLVIGASGAEAPWDEFAAGTVAMALRALVKTAAAEALARRELFLK